MAAPRVAGKGQGPAAGGGGSSSLGLGLGLEKLLDPGDRSWQGAASLEAWIPCSQQKSRQATLGDDAKSEANQRKEHWQEVLAAYASGDFKRSRAARQDWPDRSRRSAPARVVQGACRFGLAEGLGGASVSVAANGALSHN